MHASPQMLSRMCEIPGRTRSRPRLQVTSDSVEAKAKRKDAATMNA